MFFPQKIFFLLCLYKKQIYVHKNVFAQIFKMFAE